MLPASLSFKVVQPPGTVKTGLIKLAKNAFLLLNYQCPCKTEQTGQKAPFAEQNMKFRNPQFTSFDENLPPLEDEYFGEHCAQCGQVIEGSLIACPFCGEELCDLCIDLHFCTNSEN